jgi:hypothetical protein
MEVHLRPIAAILVDPCIINSELNDLAQASAFLSKINHDTNTTSLCAFDGLSKGKD